MPSQRAVRAVRRFSVVACCVTVLGGPGWHPGALRTARTTSWALVALGDSVPYGTACHCRPYPDLTARDLAGATGDRARTANHAVAGFTSGDVLAQLESDDEVRADVRNADAVMVEIGANDVAPSDTCKNDVACYAPEVDAMEQNLESIVARIVELNRARRPLVVLLDYWSVWLGGQYAEDQGPEYSEAAASLTETVNAAIEQVAGTSRSTYVDLRRAFRGPSDRWDETNLLASDGEHPNARGHHRIAGALQRTVRRQRRGPGAR